MDLIQHAADGGDRGADSKEGQIKQFLDDLNEKMIGEFDSLAEKQKHIPAENFNNDDNYKGYLNEVF